MCRSRDEMRERGEGGRRNGTDGSAGRRDGGRWQLTVECVCACGCDTVSTVCHAITARSATDRGGKAAEARRRAGREEKGQARGESRREGGTSAEGNGREGRRLRREKAREPRAERESKRAARCPNWATIGAQFGHSCPSDSFFCLQLLDSLAGAVRELAR